ncbi:LOW QUALITY PROTEIN: olfactory receptor 1S1-like [Hipposideros larvatus]
MGVPCGDMETLFRLQVGRNTCQGNQTTIFEFFLLGLSDQAEQRKLLLMLFLGMYLVTVVGNGLIILAISLDSYLHTPMYLFLANLSFADISSIAIPVPKMLMNIQTNSQSISYASCIQVHFSIVFVVIDNFLLGVMAYDRFVAVCLPLNYTTTMQPRLCILLTVISWVFSNIIALTHTLLLLQLCFCDNSTLAHFFCDLGPLLKLSCSDTMINELVLLIVGLLTITFLFAFIHFLQYIHIIRAVLRISSTEGKWKTFLSCASHLTVVLLFYGTTVGLYFFPSPTHPDDRYKIGAVLFTVVMPMMNPFIYSLRNKNMKGALRKLIHRKKFLPLMP